jgi:hypothetical protein
MLVTFIVCCISQPEAAGFFTPHLALSVEGGATRSFLKTDGHMALFFAPTSGVTRSDRPAMGILCDLTIGNYLGLSTGMGYRGFGQSTTPTTVLLKNDIFEHDFESCFRFDYFTIPILLKAGIRKSSVSAFGRFGVVPSLLINEKTAWIIDGNEIVPGSSHIPAVSVSWWDIPLSLGGEIGFHRGKNGFFISGQCLYGVHSIATGLSGHVFNRSYGATLQYRRELL